MNFQMPAEITAKLAELDAFVEAEIKPLERENIQYFDHRREWARTDWENDGRMNLQWRAVVAAPLVTIKCVSTSLALDSTSRARKP